MQTKNKYYMDELNPFVSEQKIKVIAKNQKKSIMSTEQLLSGDRIIENPELGNISVYYLLDTANKVSIFMTPELRVIYMRLSEVSHKLLRYIEGIVRNGEDIVKINIPKFMEEAEVKSRTTVYKGIEELCRYTFITPYHKQTYYWINPFRFFNGSRIDKYSKNIEKIN